MTKPKEPGKPLSGDKRDLLILAMGVVVGVLVVVVGGVLLSSKSSPRPESVPASPNSVVEDTVHSQDAPLGTPLLVHRDGLRSGPIASVLVRGLQQVRSGAVPIQGTLYAVNVVIDAVDGTAKVRRFDFSARTELGTNLTPVPDGREPLPSTELPQGQKVSGWLVFDVPTGQSIKEIVLGGGLGGGQLARWTAT